MFLYSTTINSFLERLRGYAREIIHQEMGLKVNRNRVHWGRMLIPFYLVVFEDKERLGFFDARSYCIGVHRKFLYQAKSDIIKDLLRHELAHFYTFLQHGSTLTPHDPHFREICQHFWPGKDIALATLNIDSGNQRLEGDISSEKMIARIKKLWALGKSDNPFEAELATLKANALLLQHNLQRLEHGKDEEILYQKRVLEFKRHSSKYQAIYEILQTFFVAPVFSRCPSITFLEVSGTAANVEVADYAAQFLNAELERLWEQCLKENDFSCKIIGKNSFMRGIAKGYVQKIKSQQENLATSTALIQLKDQLTSQISLAYPHLGSTRHSYSTHDHHAESLGIKSGKNLSIHPGIQRNSRSATFLLFDN
ncbi:MAG: DUF2786 domain-containing protein [Pseudomonadota bacterium]